MLEDKMVNQIIVWGIGKEYCDAISRNLLWDNSLLLVDILENGYIQ